MASAAGKQHRESTGSELRSVAQEMLNQRLAAMGRGEKSPTEIKSIRYEDMRQILIDSYREKKIGTLVEKQQADGTVKVLDFGLSKAMEPASGLSPSVSGPMRSRSTRSASASARTTKRRRDR